MATWRFINCERRRRSEYDARLRDKRASLFGLEEVQREVA
jgi:hypothetical protein